MVFAVTDLPALPKAEDLDEASAKEASRAYAAWAKLPAWMQQRLVGRRLKRRQLCPQHVLDALVDLDIVLRHQRHGAAGAPRARRRSCDGMQSGVRSRRLVPGLMMERRPPSRVQTREDEETDRVCKRAKVCKLICSCRKSC